MAINPSNGKVPAPTVDPTGLEVLKKQLKDFTDTTGLKVLRSELTGAAEAMKTGLVVGAFELATGGSKTKAVWESIKWGVMTRAGVAGFAMVLGAISGLAGGLRIVLRESGSLEAAMKRLAVTKILGQQFTQFLGSVQAAKQRVEELYNFVATTKFNMAEAANASRALTIMSNGALGGSKTLEMLGRISKVTGIDLETLSATYARLNSQTRNKQDITSTVEELKDMGVISESTASNLSMLSRTGASATTIWTAVSESFEQVSQSAKDTEPSFEELQDRYIKLRTSMAEKFGAPFLEAERTGMQNTIKLMEALTPAVETLGKMLAQVTKPAEDLKSQLGAIAGTDWFKDLAKKAAELAVVLPGVIGLYQTGKGAVRFAKTTAGVAARGFKAGVEGFLGEAPGAAEVVPGASKAAQRAAGTAAAFKEVKDAALAAVSPAVASANFAISADRLREEQQKQLEKQLLLTGEAEKSLARATALEAEAQIAAVEKDVVRTAALTAEAVEQRALSVAQAEQAAAAGMAATKNAAGALASEVASKGLKGFSTVLGLVRSGLVQFASWALRAAGPFIILTGIAMLAAKAWEKWTDARERSAAAANMAKETAAANAEMTTQIALLKTMDDRTKLLTESRKAYLDALEEQGKINADVNSTEAQRSAAEAKVTGARRNMRRVEQMDTSKLGPGTQEIERLQRQVMLQKEIREIIFDAAFAQASGAKQVLMLMQRQRDMMKVVADAARTAGTAKEIGETKEALDTAKEAQKTKLEGLAKERSAQEELLEKQKTAAEGVTAMHGEREGRGFTFPEEEEVDKTTAKIGELTDKIKEMRTKGSPDVVALQEKLTKLQEGPEAPMAEKFEAEAKRAANSGDMATAAALRLRAATERITGPEEAEKRAKADELQVEALKRAGALKGAELNVNQEILSVTSETAQAEDVVAKARIEGLEKQRAMTVDIGEKQAEKDPVARKQRENQIRDIEQQQQTIRNEMADRERQRTREKAAIASSIRVRELDNTAMVAAAKGDFDKANAAVEAARLEEDRQHDEERGRELTLQYGKVEGERILKQEQSTRIQERASRSEAFATTETRRIREMQLENLEKGIQPVGGVLAGGGRAPAGAGAARAELLKMQDLDYYHEQLTQNLKEMPGQAEQAKSLAVLATQTKIQGEQQEQGMGAIGDSLTRIGGGGGYYAGAAGDPQLSATKRIGDLLLITNEKLENMKPKIPVN
jgi:hypothetical protein